MSVVTTRLQVWCEDQSGTRGSSFVNEFVMVETWLKVFPWQRLFWTGEFLVHFWTLLSSDQTPPHHTACLPEDSGMLRIPSVLGVPLIEGWGTNQASTGMYEILIKLIPKRWNKGKQGFSLWRSSEIFEPSSYGPEHQCVGRLVAKQPRERIHGPLKGNGIHIWTAEGPWCLCLAWDGSHDLHSVMALWVRTHPN